MERQHQNGKIQVNQITVNMIFSVIASLGVRVAAQEAGVQVLFYSRVAACEKTGASVRRVLISTEAGNYEASAKIFIDATGNGNLAGMAGCRFEWGEPGTGRMSPATTGFSVVGLPEEYDGTNSAIEKREYNAMLKAQPGLFLAGEMLDIDGPCGGYNLQWAWSSGAAAGRAAAEIAATVHT